MLNPQPLSRRRLLALALTLFILQPFFAFACGPRPEEELYDLRADPDQLRNVAADGRYTATLAQLRNKLAAELRAAGDPRFAANNTAETRPIAGWTVHVSRKLLAQEPKITNRALELLENQLLQIGRAVPASAVAELQKVPLYFSPEYPVVKPRAEFHPNAGWLREHGRDPAMAKGVEFTNIRIFERELNRMPNFALHELAHAYHDRVLGNGNAQIKAAYEKAKASGKYERVERWHGNGKPNTFERAYAMTNPQEYFAENTEAFFCRNDFFPFTRDELKRHDPEMFELLAKLWGVSSNSAPSFTKETP